VRRVCVFCGSNVGGRPEYAAAARQLGTVLARRGLGLVYGGGSVGLMGVLADAALAAGGEVIGVIPRALATKEIAHHGLTGLEVVPSMHARKARMAELADAFVALPGGFGTLEELLEMVTWAQLGLHVKPIGVLSVNGYFDGLLALVEHAIAERFVHPGHRELLVSAPGAEALLAALERATPRRAPRKWLALDET
jgi:hypothetical protein